MDIKELENYRLSDAVKFNDTLNPRLWGSDENLLPEVREKLLAIANDFREFLGVPDLRVQDITVSGSNAAYTYTPHSDIDLHLVVDLPEDAVYRELFDAKKYQYNTQHNIKIAGYDVELYVQPAGDTHHSQGIYSVKNSDWISVPQRRHPDVDDISVQSKYEDIGHRIEQAIESGDLAQIVAVAKKVKQMRQAGLDQTGEFGPENLAFKALRSNGTLDQLRAALQAAQDRQLSLDEEQRNKTKKKHHYGRVGGMWLPGYEYKTTAPEIANESQDRGQVRDTIKQFARSCFRQYGLKNPPKIRIQHNPNWSERTGTFGRFDPDTNTIELAVTGRHMLDILRTLAHELTHAKQNEQGEMPDDAGRTGSPYEDDANAQAGRMMRHWAEQHPDQFKDTKLDEATGYIPVNSREAQDPRYSMALTVDIKPGEVQRQAAKMGWKTDAAGRPPLLMAFQNQLASSKRPSTALTENVETIAEGATDVLYHMTSTRSAANILADGVFKLASSVGTKAEEKYAPPDRPYFLSTSRSKAGDYSRSVGTSAVMFDLNGQWLAQRYQVKPIDYWDRAWLNNPERTSESEDRVFSKDPEISIACVTSVHALIKTADEWRSPYTRQVLLLAKQRGIPAFLYTDPKAWKLQDTRNAVSPQQASALLKGSTPVRTQYKPASSYLEPWLELIHKKAKSELSPKAEKLRYNLVYYGLRYPNEDNGLADDMNNSRKPDSPDYANVDKLIKFMRANRMAKPVDLKNALAQKWDAINTKERDSAKAQEPVAEDTVDEMALSTYKTMGDFDKPGPFTGADKKLVPHAKNIEKATKFFEQNPYDFRLFFSNIPGTGKYGEYGPMTPDQIRKIFGADAEEIIQGSEDAITVVYVGNRGEAKVMLTPWVMAHRLGHAIQAGARGTRAGHVWTAAEKHFFTTVNSTLAEHYGKVDRGPSSYLGRPKAEQANVNLTPEYNALFNAIGTQRSSRSGQILRPYEFLYEIFAQYLGTGRITFNPFPANLTYGRKAFGNPTKFMNIRPEYRDELSRKEAADRLAYDMEIMFDSVLSGSVGKILVM